VEGDRSPGPGGSRDPRRILSDLAASGIFHLISVGILLWISLEEKPALPVTPPQEEAVPMTFVQPQPIPAPVLPGPAAPPAPKAQQTPPPAAEPLTPIVPLAEPNRMGDTPPVPPPPKPSAGGTPTEKPPGPPDAQKGAPQKDPAQKGTPDSESLTGAMDRGDSRPAAPGNSPPLSTTPDLPSGTSGLPSAPRKPSPGAGGFDPGASGRRPRRGMDLGVPFDTGATANFTFEHPDFDWSDWWPQMYQRIKIKWHERLYVSLLAFEREAQLQGRPGLKGKAVLRFTVERNGNVSKIELVTPSSIQPLDLASSDAIREADLPRLPTSFPYEQERIEGTFLLDVPEMRWFRESLSAMKIRGMF